MSDAWNENDVERDLRGRFAPERRGRLMPVPSDKAERYQAYRDARKRKAKRRARSAPDRIGLVMVDEPVSLRELQTERTTPAARVLVEDARANRKAQIRNRRRDRIRQSRENRLEEAKRRGAAAGGKGGKLDLRGDRVVYVTGDQLNLLQTVSETGGRVDETDALADLLAALSEKAVPIDTSVAGAEAFKSHNEMPASFDGRPPVFASAQEADDYAHEFRDRLWDLYDTDPKHMPLKARQFVERADANRYSTIMTKASRNPADAEGESTWIPRLWFSSGPEPIMLVASEGDWKRLSRDRDYATGLRKEQVDDMDLISLADLLKASGYGAEHPEHIQDAYVQVIRMRF